jgi:hypothetical protein
MNGMGSPLKKSVPKGAVFAAWIVEFRVYIKMPTTMSVHTR